ncbi:MAG: alpha/beta fold hydrolase [Synechococcus sp.]
MTSLVLSTARHSYKLYHRHPDQPTLVFVHGWMLSRHYWQPLCDRLSPYNCLTYDLRGFGDSAVGNSNHFDLVSYARDLLELIDRLELTQVWLVGHSMGGSIALWAADLAPERVDGVFCVNAGGGIYLKEEFERFRAAGQQIVKLRPSWLAQFPGLAWYFCRDNVVNPLAKHWGNRRLKDFVAADASAARGSLLDSTTEAEVHQLPQVVKRLNQPAYFFAGSSDTVMEPKYVHHLASFHRNYRSQEIVFELPNCGHLGMLEQTGEIANRMHSILATAPARSA